MTLKREVECDYCGLRRDWNGPDLGWSTLKLGTTEQAPRRDFCSTPCLANWSAGEAGGHGLTGAADEVSAVGPRPPQEPSPSAASPSVDGTEGGAS